MLSSGPKVLNMWSNFAPHEIFCSTDRRRRQLPCMHLLTWHFSRLAGQIRGQVSVCCTCNAQWKNTMLKLLWNLFGNPRHKNFRYGAGRRRGGGGGGGGGGVPPFPLNFSVNFLAKGEWGTLSVKKNHQKLAQNSVVWGEKRRFRRTNFHFQQRTVL